MIEEAKGNLESCVCGYHFAVAVDIGIDARFVYLCGTDVVINFLCPECGTVECSTLDPLIPARGQGI